MANMLLNKFVNVNVGVDGSYRLRLRPRHSYDVQNHPNHYR